MHLDAALTEQYAPTQNSSSRAGDAVRQALDRLRTRLGIRRANRGSANDPIIAAMLARLETIGHEIDRVTRLALQEQDVARQEALLALARDLQREVRGIREQIRGH
jgi:hypothetical protein